MDLKRLSPWETTAGVAGLGLILVLFMPWWSPEQQATSDEEVSGPTGWELLSFIDILLFIGGAAVVGLVVAKAVDRRIRVPLATGALIAIVGLLAAGLATYRLAVPPSLVSDVNSLSDGSSSDSESLPFGLEAPESSPFGGSDSVGIPGVIELSTGESVPRLEPLGVIAAIAVGLLLVLCGYKLMRRQGTTPAAQFELLKARFSGGEGGDWTTTTPTSDRPAAGAPPPPPIPGAGPPPGPDPTAERAPEADPPAAPSPPPPPAGPTPGPAEDPPSPAPAPGSHGAGSPPPPDARLDPRGGGTPRPAAANLDPRPLLAPILVAVAVAIVAGIAVWEHVVRDDETGSDVALSAESDEGATALPSPEASDEGGAGVTESGGVDPGDSEATTDSSSTSDAPTPSDLSLRQYSSAAGGWTAEVPSGSGWSEATETQVNPGLHRTTFDGPDGAVLIVDSTPAERPQYEGSASRTTVTHPSFGEVEKLTFRGNSTLTPCETSTCVDFLIPAGSGGYAVLAGGSRDFTELEAIAEQVMRSLQST
jgi:hypothetical protein